jgi:hypothetical protein
MRRLRDLVDATTPSINAVVCNRPGECRQLVDRQANDLRGGYRMA